MVDLLLGVLLAVCSTGVLCVQEISVGSLNDEVSRLANYTQGRLNGVGGVLGPQMNRLTDEILHHEAVFYNQDDLDRVHNEVKTGAIGKFSVDAMGRTFKLVFWLDNSILHPDYRDEEGDDMVLLKGHIEDEEGSRLLGFVYNKTMHVELWLADGSQVWIVPSLLYGRFPHHSVIFHSDHIANTPLACGVGSNSNSSSHVVVSGNDGANGKQTGGTADGNSHSGESYFQHHHIRKRRSAKTSTKKNGITLGIFYHGNCLKHWNLATDDKLMKRLLYTQVSAAQTKAFANPSLDYPGRIKGSGEGYKFMIREVKKVSWGGKFDNKGFLNRVSQEKVTQAITIRALWVCRDIKVLGFGHVRCAGRNGGYCSGVTTLWNDYNPHRAAMTFAHEAGHNFGADHDGEGGGKACPVEGHIMQPAGLSSKSTFSKCTVEQFNAHMMKAGYKAFQEYKLAYCGNGIREDDEECDCGSVEDCKNDTCCHDHKAGKLACNYTTVIQKKATCSPSNDECCNIATCQPAGKTTFVCKNTTTCSHESYCSPTEAKCEIEAKNDDGNKFFVCDLQENTARACGETGFCNASICLGQKDLRTEDCSCLEGADRCKICCQKPGQEGTCAPADQIKNKHDTPTTMYKPRGTLCAYTGMVEDGLDGFCDLWQECKPHRSDLECVVCKLKKDANAMLKWVKDNPAYAAIVGAAVLVFVIGFTVGCSKVTPSTNPSAPPAIDLRKSFRRNRNAVVQEPARSNNRASRALEMESFPENHRREPRPNERASRALEMESFPDHHRREPRPNERASRAFEMECAPGRTRPSGHHVV